MWNLLFRMFIETIPLSLRWNCPSFLVSPKCFDIPSTSIMHVTTRLKKPISAKEELYKRTGCCCLQQWYLGMSFVLKWICIRCNLACITCWVTSRLGKTRGVVFHGSEYYFWLIYYSIIHIFSNDKDIHSGPITRKSWIITHFALTS